jgi:formyltetrahydrofolate-dependent phosphoribosylglycinamide formyltransferase
VILRHEHREDPPAGDSARRPLVLAVLLSGTGRTLENLLRVIAAGELDARVGVVVSSVPGVRGLQIAGDAGIPHLTIRRRDYPSDEAYSQAIYAALAPSRPDLILLAGFLRRLVVPPEWAGRILNIHPALLPESGAAGRGFYGERVHAAVLASGATVSGATVHVVDDGYDTGPIFLKTAVPVLPGDTVERLAARVFAAECELYPAAIRKYVAEHPKLFGPAIASGPTPPARMREEAPPERPREGRSFAKRTGED